MEQLTVAQLLQQFGTAGLFIGFLIWDRLERAKEAKERLETEKASASALAALSAILNAFVTSRRGDQP